MKKKIKIYFVDFWDTFKIEDNYFLNILNEKYDVQIDPVNPDYLFYSNFGIEFINYNCVRIYYTGENIRPDFNECDWAFSFDYSDNPRNYRLPLYALFADMEELTLPRDPERLFNVKTEFCNFIYSNPGAKKRVDFFHKLSKYKHIHSAGRFMNNIGKPIGGFEAEKMAFIRKYKFSFSFENSSYIGYTTEKIIHPFLCNSIPLYWGNPEVAKDFNPRSFLNWHDYNNDEAFLEKIIELDNNKSLYLDMLAEPPFEDNIINRFVEKNNVQERLVLIIETEIETVSSKSTGFSENQLKSKLWFAKKRFNYKTEKMKKKMEIFQIDRMKVRLQLIKEKYYKK